MTIVNRDPDIPSQASRWNARRGLLVGVAFRGYLLSAATMTFAGLRWWSGACDWIGRWHHCQLG
jgi:hypothetical protein